MNTEAAEELPSRNSINLGPQLFHPMSSLHHHTATVLGLITHLAKQVDYGHHKKSIAFFSGYGTKRLGEKNKSH